MTPEKGYPIETPHARFRGRAISTIYCRFWPPPDTLPETVRLFRFKREARRPGSTLNRQLVSATRHLKAGIRANTLPRTFIQKKLPKIR